MRITRQTIYRIIQWVVLLAAYSFLGYKLWTFDGYTEWFDYIRSVRASRFLWFIPVLLLVPVNILLEACRWRTLTAAVYPVSLSEACRAVVYGQLTAFITPYRVGDYPGRIGLMLSGEENTGSLWPQLLGVGVVNSVLITAVILAFGMPAACSRLLATDLYTTVGILLCMVIALCLLPFFTEKMRAEQLFVALFESVARYFVWLIQLAMVLYGCGISLSIEQILVLLPTYYLFVTITPSLPAADPAVRGSWLLAVLSCCTDATVSVTLAAVLIWIFNTLLPTLMGSFVRLSKR